MPRLICLFLAALTLAGCGRVPTPSLGFMSGNLRPSEQLPYDARLIADRRDPAFSVAVADGGAGLDAVRETVRFYGTRHCLTRFGSSSIDWTSAAGNPDAWAAMRGPDGRSVYSGRCTGR